MHNRLVKICTMCIENKTRGRLWFVWESFKRIDIKRKAQPIVLGWAGGLLLSDVDFFTEDSPENLYSDKVRQHCDNDFFHDHTSYIYVNATFILYYKIK